MPRSLRDDREILETAPLGRLSGARGLILWIADTLHLAEVECSRLLEEARGRPDLEILTEPRALPLDSAGNLPPMLPQ